MGLCECVSSCRGVARAEIVGTVEVARLAKGREALRDSLHTVLLLSFFFFCYWLSQLFGNRAGDAGLVTECGFLYRW